MIIVPAHAALEIEQLGSRDKYWFRSEDEHIRTLFKVGRPNTGEHWAEIVVARIAAYLSIPHAPYELASGGRLGVATPSLVQVHGAARVLAPTFDHAASLACRLTDRCRGPRKSVRI
jgi:hypothetical protein